MSKIAAKLSRNPNVEFIFDHNGQIKELLLALGIETHFTQTPPKSSTGNTVQVVEHLFHATHYIVVALFLGYDDPKENGYHAVCLPKSKNSPEQCADFFKKYSARVSTGEILEHQIKWGRKPGHSSN